MMHTRTSCVLSPVQAVKESSGISKSQFQILGREKPIGPAYLVQPIGPVYSWSNCLGADKGITCVSKLLEQEAQTSSFKAEKEWKGNDRHHGTVMYNQYFDGKTKIMNTTHCRKITCSISCPNLPF